MSKRKILFLTGTRADFGKLKPLIKAVEQSGEFRYNIFVTGMHTLSRYGLTVNEVYKEGFKNVHVFMNQTHGDPMDLVLANTITGFSRYISEFRPDLIVVHGDRVEALAGAIVGSLNNILVAHVEGGELSGTIDGVIRHAISKLAHLHFVSNGEASARLKQLGELPENIFAIGSPDIDIMLSPQLPSIQEVKERYAIDFDRYGLVLFHSVTTELDRLEENVEQLLQALLQSGRKYVVIYPNNDVGCDVILNGYAALREHSNFKIFPSLRFEFFLTLLKHADFLLGNSSAGIHEAPVYGIYSINIGTRQRRRFAHASILNVGYSREEILQALESIEKLPPCKPCYLFGRGDSARRFLEVLKGEEIWKTERQKEFQDLAMLKMS